MAKSVRIARSDYLATEEPLEIRLITPSQTQRIAVTMRTPGADFELAVGFLFAEGIIKQGNRIESITYCVDPELDADQRYNVVNVTLAHDVQHNNQTLERHFIVNSSCGICGKASLDALEADGLQAVTS